MPDLIQPVIGFRTFCSDDGLLRSSGAGDAIWDPDVTIAECEGFDKVHALAFYESSGEPAKAKTPHPAPDKNCGCGLYAYHKPAHLFAAVGLFGPRPSRIKGAIAAWGRMEIHPTGFRAEKARVVALALDDLCAGDPKRREQIEQLACIYGARAVPSYLLTEEAYKYGIATPKKLRPVEQQPFEDWGHIHPSRPYALPLLAKKPLQSYSIRPAERQVSAWDAFWRGMGKVYGK